ncbi:hypothetical protein EHN07_01480 [Buttiauxella warmboldiae]|uniref:PEGA domain-containing protein n=1 Tax=Buttiauxella warmboldiae TaxID=82993 RepID=A0A3N5E6W7_9ENTR|nr:hypothetical protein [Buttiauxella warmboldiae]RPH30959.1 hypothetical protein EHN07_01480 [Buttiauxella warmboldiae]
MAKILSLLVASLLISGCASIVGEQAQTLYIESKPTGANFVISDNHGTIAARGITPQYITLPKADGSYFGKLSYTVTFLDANHYPTIVPLQSRLNGWYTFGNLITFGIPGWLLIDPFNGGMYKIYPMQINAIMRPCPRGPFSYTCP